MNLEFTHLVKNIFGESRRERKCFHRSRKWNEGKCSFYQWKFLKKALRKKDYGPCYLSGRYLKWMGCLNLEIKAASFGNRGANWYSKRKKWCCTDCLKKFVKRIAIYQHLRFIHTQQWNVQISARQSSELCCLYENRSCSVYISIRNEIW